YYLDDSYLGRTKVSPFSLKWNILMHDNMTPTLKAALATPKGQPLPELNYDAHKNKLEDDLTTITPVTETLTAALSVKGDRVIAQFPNGFGMILDSGGYTETHQVKVRAF